MFKHILQFCFLIIFSCQLYAFENILNIDKNIAFHHHHKPEWATFIVSTEMSLKSAEHMFQQAPPGLFMSVGTERAFQGLSHSAKATHALFIDYDENITRFNKINAQLLKARTLSAYRNLRWDADFNAWNTFARKNKTYKVELSKDDYDWWEKNARDIAKVGNVRMEYVNRYGNDFYYHNFVRILNEISTSKNPEKTPVDKLYLSSFSEWKKAAVNLNENDWIWWNNFIVNPQFFAATQGKKWLEPKANSFDLLSFRDLKSSNYLFNEKLYKKLHTLAITNRIAAATIDIRNKEHTAKLVSAIAQSKIKIGVIDLDNVYMSGYMGTTNAYNEFVVQLLPLGNPKSVLIAMAFGLNLEPYFGFSFENIKQWPSTFSISRFVEENSGYMDLIDGKLFEGAELPVWIQAANITPQN